MIYFLWSYVIFVLLYGIVIIVNWPEFREIIEDGKRKIPDRFHKRYLLSMYVYVFIMFVFSPFVVSYYFLIILFKNWLTK